MKQKIHFSVLEVSLRDAQHTHIKAVTVVIRGEDIKELNNNQLTMRSVCQELGIKKENVRKTLSEGKVKILRILRHKTFMGYTNA